MQFQNPAKGGPLQELASAGFAGVVSHRSPGPKSAAPVELPGLAKVGWLLAFPRVSGLFRIRG